MKEKLKKFFKKVASNKKKIAAYTLASVTGLMGAGYGAAAATGRPLTPGEKEKAAGVYGDEISLKNIRLHHADMWFFDKSGFTFFNQIWFFDGNPPVRDYSKGPGNMGTLMHELMHVGQYWGFDVRGALNCTVYPYDVNYIYDVNPGDTFDKDKNKKQRCIESKAKMVENYFTRNSAENDPLLRQVVEDRFPRARATRLFKAKALALATPAQNHASMSVQQLQFIPRTPSLYR
jgi:hypothetical protein